MSRDFNFTLSQMEYVLAIHKYGHFNKAAAACHITQPTLSMQLQKLEEELGLVIFDRSKKPILPTAVGQKIIAQMQTVLFETKKIQALIESSRQASLSGSLSFGVIPTLAPYVLPLLLPKLEQQYPQIELVIREMQTHRIIEALSDDEIDVGLLATPLNEAKIHEYPLYYEPFYLLCQNHHPLSRLKKVRYQNLNLDDLWLLEEGHCLRNQVLDVCAKKSSQKTKRKFQFESGSIETLKNLVESYGGYTLIPALARGAHSAQSIVLPFERPIPARQIGLVYRREHYKNHLIEALGETLISAIPEDIRKLRQKDLDVLPVDSFE